MFPAPKRWVVAHPKTTLFLLYGVPGVLQIALLWSIGTVFSTFRHDPASLEHLAHALGNLRLAVGTYVGLAAVFFVGGGAGPAHGRVARSSAPRNNQPG